MSTGGMPPILVIVLVILGVANLVPFLIYLDYKRRLYRQVRRNSDQTIETLPDDMFDEEEAVPETAYLSSSENDEEGEECKDKLSEVCDENGEVAKERARSFVAKQEQILQAARSRWGSRGKGYGVLTSVSTNA